VCHDRRTRVSNVRSYRKGNRKETVVSDNQVQPNPERDPEQWVTGDEPMTGPQASYLQTLCQEAGERFDPNLTKAQASEKIDALQSATGRGA
jgi:hypothetical protein